MPGTDLHVAAVHVHASDHAALGGHVCPVDHLLCIVEVQRHCVIQTLEMAEGVKTSTGAQKRAPAHRLRRCGSNLFDQGVVGTVQVEFPQVVPVGKDQIWLLFYRGKTDM